MTVFNAPGHACLYIGKTFLNYNITGYSLGEPGNTNEIIEL